MFACTWKHSNHWMDDVDVSSHPSCPIFHGAKYKARVHLQAPAGQNVCEALLILDSLGSLDLTPNQIKTKPILFTSPEVLIAASALPSFLNLRERGHDCPALVDSSVTGQPSWRSCCEVVLYTSSFSPLLSLTFYGSSVPKDLK